MALAATGSLRRLRKLDSALTATSSAAPAFLELQPLQRDVARLVPSRGNAEAEKTGAEAQKTDLERTQSKTTAALAAHEELCKASEAALSTEAELRAEVQSALAGAAETLQSNVFTSLVERSAAALDLPVSFLQVDQKHMPA